MSAPDSHLDDDQVALRALGEPLPRDAMDHVAGCRECALEVSAFQRIVTAARDDAADTAEVSDPSPEVWTRIKQQLHLNPEEQATASDGEPDRVVISLGERRRRWSTATVVAASVASIIVGATLTLGGAALLGDDQPTPSATRPSAVLEQTDLVALPNRVGSGTAEVVQTARGPELIVDVEALSAGAGFHEVWLIDPKTMQMVGLGALNDNSGRFQIPDGLDLSQYSLVDVSIEPFDGDPTHSGDSVVRGQLAV